MNIMKSTDLAGFYADLNSDISHYISSNDICTPIDCVKEMVDSIPNSFWRRQNLDILDPCCGNGNFHAYIQTLINDSATLYFNEINPDRVRILKSIFGDSIVLTQKDFLSFGVARHYDLIVANPPYAQMQDNGVRASKNHSLSRAFINKALSLVKPDGFVLFIAPDNWMSFSDRNTLPRIMSHYQFHHINIHGAKRYFPKVGSSFTWFLLQKSANTMPATIQNFYGKRDSAVVTIDKGVNFIPLYYNETVRSIINKVVDIGGGANYAVETSSDLHRTTRKDLIRDEKSAEFCHRLIHTPKQTVYAARPHKWQKGWKVFISLTDKYGTKIDHCGMTQSIAFIRCASKAEAVQIGGELQAPIYRFINHITRYGNFNNIRVLQSLRKWGRFTLTQAENACVEDYLKTVGKNGGRALS